MIFTEELKLVNYTDASQKEEIHEAEAVKTGWSKAQVRKFLIILGACFGSAVVIVLLFVWFLHWLKSM